MTTYYVSQSSGSDPNNGTSTATPWKTVAKVNASTFQPGDSVLFKCGDTWREALTPPSSGTSGNVISFGSYGSGANPLFNGSAVLPAGSFGTFTVTPAYLVNVTPTVASDDGATRNYRQTFLANFTSTTVQIKLTAASGGSWVIAGTSIGPQSSGAAASSLTRITWNSGSNGVTIPANSTATSDVLTIPITKGQTYLVHIYMTSRHLEEANDFSGTAQIYSDGNGADETLLLSPSGSQLATVTLRTQVLTQVIGSNQTVYTQAAPSYAISSLTSSGTTATATTSTNHQLQTAQLITLQGATPSGYNGSYRVTVTSPTSFTYTLSGSLSSPATGTISYYVPAYEVWENNGFLPKVASAAATVAWGSWFWDSSANLIYLNASDNSDPRTSGKVYETTWQTYGIYDNKKSWLDISHIDCIQTYGSGDAAGNINSNLISGIYLSGSNNTVHDLTSKNHSRHCFSFYVSAVSCTGYNLTLANCEETTTFVAFGNSGGSPNTTGCVLRNSRIYNDNAWCIHDGLVRFHGGSTNCTLQDCEIYVTQAAKNTTEHVDIYEAGTSGHTIQDCYFHGYQTSLATIGVTSAGTGLSGITFANNLIDWTNGTGGGLVLGAHVTGIKAYNNTFYSPTSTSYFVAGHTATGSTITAENNIVYSPGAVSLDAGSVGILTADYNCWYHPSGITFVNGSNTYTSLATWQAATGQGAHSISADPLFTNAGNGQFWLQPTSPCLLAGANLGSSFASALISTAAWPAAVLTGLQGAVWTMGAYLPLLGTTDGTWIVPVRLRTWTISKRLRTWTSRATRGTIMIIPKYAAESLVLSFNLANVAEIVAGDTITSITSITGSPSGLTIGASSISGSTIKVAISGDTAGTLYTVSVIFVTSSGAIVEEQGGLQVM